MIPEIRKTENESDNCVGFLPEGTFRPQRRDVEPILSRTSAKLRRQRSEFGVPGKTRSRCWASYQKSGSCTKKEIQKSA